MRKGATLYTVLSVMLLLAGCAGSLEYRDDQRKIDPEQVYWREFWLLKELSSEEEFQEFTSELDEDAAGQFDAQEKQRRWLAAWWQRHDPDWTTPQNEWREYIDSLVEIADWRYDRTMLASKLQPPWDDRGLFLIHFGPPDQVEFVSAVACRTFNSMMLYQGELWTWFPHSNRNKRLLEVVFAPGCDFEYVARPRSRSHNDLMQFARNKAFHKISPPAGYSPDDREALSFTLNTYRFHDSGDSADLWLAYAFPVDELCDDTDSALLRCTFVLQRNEMPHQLRFALAQSTQISRLKELRACCRREPEGDIAMQVERFLLTPADYQIGVKVDDLTNTDRGFTGKLTATIVPFVDPSTQRLVSDAMPLAVAPMTGEDNGLPFTREIAGQRLNLRPLPGHVLRRRRDTLRVYHEVYALVPDRGGSTQALLTYTLYRDRDGVQTPLDTLFSGIVEGRHLSLPCYQSFALDSLNKGEYFLLIESHDPNDHQPPFNNRDRQTILRFRIS